MLDVLSCSIISNLASVNKSVLKSYKTKFRCSTDVLRARVEAHESPGHFVICDVICAGEHSTPKAAGARQHRLHVSHVRD